METSQPKYPKDDRHRKCAKCGATNQDTALRFHRFPLPGARGCARAQAWAEYSFPNKKWSSKDQLIALYNKQTVLCSKHFDDTSYIGNNKAKLNVFSVPKGAIHIYDRLRGYERLRNSKPRDHDYELGTKDLKLAENLQVPQNSTVTTLQESVHTELEPTQTDVSKQPKDANGAVKYEETSWHANETRDDRLCYTFSTRASEPSSVSPPSSPTADIGDFTDSPGSVKSETIETCTTEATEEWYQEAAPRMCRVCLRVGDDGDHMPLLILHGTLTPLAHTMLALAPDIQISPDDVLPKQLCGACADDALRAERFLKQARHTQQRLAGLEPAAVAEDVFQSSLFSHYFPSDTTSVVPHPAAEDAVVSLTFDGENLEFEKFEFASASNKTVQPKNRVPSSKNVSVEVPTPILEVSPPSRDQAVFAEPLYTVSEDIDRSDGIPSSLDSSPILEKLIYDAMYPTNEDPNELPPPTLSSHHITDGQPSLCQSTSFRRTFR